LKLLVFHIQNHPKNVEDSHTIEKKKMKIQKQSKKKIQNSNTIKNIKNLSTIKKTLENLSTT
jgi:hypothetical protein